ncbi:MAG: DUF4166 domain-containing protein [Pseudomonadota bacterium]
MGPSTCSLALTRVPGGIGIDVAGGRLFGLPPPRALLPTGRARGVEADGRLVFDIDVHLRLPRRMVRYRGWSVPVEER